MKLFDHLMSEHRKIFQFFLLLFLFHLHNSKETSWNYFQGGKDWE